MNWYKVFYWVSVADTVSVFFQAIAIILTGAVIIASIGFFVSTSSCSSEESYGRGDESSEYKSWNEWKKAWKRVLTLGLIFGFVGWMGYIFVPSKKDALVIIAGGTVGNFITRDSSAKQIPSEVMTLLRDKIRSEIKDIHVKDIVDEDTLKNKSKDELIKLLKEKSN